MSENVKLRNDIIALITSIPLLGDEPYSIVTIDLKRSLEAKPYNHENFAIMRELDAMALDGYIKQDSTFTFYYEDGVIPPEEGDGFFK